MKKYFIALFIMTILLVAVIIKTTKTNDSCSSIYTDGNNFPGEIKKTEIQSGEKEHDAGPEREIEFFSRWHSPYSNVLPVEVQTRIQEQLQNMPSEQQMNPNAINSWVSVGPVRHVLAYHPGSYYTGRILEIWPKTYVKDTSDRFASASGGLWQATNNLPICLTDKLSSLAISTFCSKPSDQNTIFVGTGEYKIRSGTGVWKTTDRGANWTSVSIPGSPLNIFKIRFDLNNSNKIHLATSDGYYRSDNGGVTFTIKSYGIISDFVQKYTSYDDMLLVKWGDGVYRSTNGGDNWAKLTNQIPVTNVGRGSISIEYNSPSLAFLNLATNDSNKTLGVFKTTDFGNTWINTLPNYDFHWKQGWYNNAIAICPTDANLVLAGGGTLIRTTNGGASWDDYFNPGYPLYDPYNLHADIHSIVWGNNPYEVFVGSDGGYSYSSNAGINWTTNPNTFPITQFYDFDVSKNGMLIYGGSQDIGISGTTDGGRNWKLYAGGDGLGISIDQLTPGKIIFSDGVAAGSMSFPRYLSTNYGVNYTMIVTGLEPSTNWMAYVRNDNAPPLYYYTHSGKYVYRYYYGSIWTCLNPGAAFPSDVGNITVTPYISGSSVIYAPLVSFVGGSLRVYDNGSWWERGTGLNGTVRKVAIHPLNYSRVYAIMNGFTASDKLYLSTNKGVNWTNITGNLPNVPVADLIAHPSDNNKLYLGTEYGCFRTTNGGLNWHRWNNGMPEATIVTSMGYIDSLSTSGKFFVVAATYGRSIYSRDISGDDPISIRSITEEIPGKFELYQNYPNPFNPVTKIKFDIPNITIIARSGTTRQSQSVSLKVYDITGREILTLVNEQLSPGTYEVTFDGSNYPSGVYYYQLLIGDFKETKKLLLLK
jgi:photosystem II stability/assembly factor-like uncharacterized protein